MCGKYSLTKFSNFLIVLRVEIAIFSLSVLRMEIATTFKAESGSNFRAWHNNEKICELCNYIFHTLQHFSTKFWDFTTF